MSEFCFRLISWEQIDGFWWNFVYAVLWLAHEIFLNFSTELWPLIDVKILFMHWYIWSMLLLIHIIFPNYSTELWPLIDFRIMFMLIILWNKLVDLIKSGSYIAIFYAKTCTTTKISTVEGYHIVLATLLFYMRFDLGTLDSGERSLPFGLLVYANRENLTMRTYPVIWYRFFLF